MKVSSLISGAVLVGVALVLLLGVAWAGSEAYQATPPVNGQVTNELVTANESKNSTVEKADVARQFYDDEVIRNGSGALLYEGSDYEWDTDTGTIDWLNSSNYTDGETAEIDYNYTQAPPEARQLKRVYSPLLAVLPYGLLILVALSVGGIGIGLLATLPQFTSSGWGGGRR